MVISNFGHQEHLDGVLGEKFRNAGSEVPIAISSSTMPPLGPKKCPGRRCTRQFVTPLAMEQHFARSHSLRDIKLPKEQTATAARCRYFLRQLIFVLRRTLVRYRSVLQKRHGVNLMCEEGVALRLLLKLSNIPEGMSLNRSLQHV
jgi:hypothetical protein